MDLLSMKIYVTRMIRTNRMELPMDLKTQNPSRIWTKDSGYEECMMPGKYLV